jgi:hypothetical protein
MNARRGIPLLVLIPPEGLLAAPNLVAMATCPDFNADGQVNEADVLAAAGRWRRQSVDPGWDSRTAFLYTGPNPIQSGVAPGTITCQRGAILRGRVLDREGAGSALAGRSDRGPRPSRVRADVEPHGRRV